MSKLLTVFAYCFLCLASPLTAQDYGWWNSLVDWDGKTPWQEYLNLSSGGLGPNALPVPIFHPLAIDNKIRFENRLEFHNGKGDKTQNLFSMIEIPFAKKVAIRMWMVPVEKYTIDETTRDERKIREFDAQGFSIGDLYFGTYIEILKERKNRPMIMASANIKTASGNNIEAGRFTDTPGYYFDILLAKDFNISNQYKFRPFLVSGLYVYQTYDGLHAQNDAFLYSLGCVLQGPVFESTLDWSGYSGYLDIKDQPSILRLTNKFKFKRNFSLIAGIVYGMRDFPYKTYTIGCSYQMTKKEN